MRTVILIPAYRPEESFAEFAGQLVGRGHNVVAVDDGGGEAFADVFERVESIGVRVLRHEVNCGKGKALKTGIRYISENMQDVDFIVTADCDGQHRIEDIEKVIAAGEENPGCLILGGRFTEKDVKVPFRSRLGNGFTRIMFRIATGLKIKDTQTGLRGLPREMFGNLIGLKGERYEYEMNMLLNLKKWQQEYKEIPIETVYIDNNKASHYNAFKDSMRILGEILRFTIVSLSSTVIDYVAYVLFLKYVFDKGEVNLLSIFDMPQGFWLAEIAGTISLAYVCARIISSTVNYLLNRKIVFKRGSKSSIAKYVALAVSMMIIGAFGTGVFKHIGWNQYLVKMPVDTILFFVNYYFQREWVFKKRRKKNNNSADGNQNGQQ